MRKTMNGKKLLTGLLLLFVVASVGFLLFNESGRGPEAGSGPALSLGASTTAVLPEASMRPWKSPGPGTRVVAYYFHGRVRCVSCVRIESLSGKAIRERFPGELRSGLLSFRKVNVEEPGNRHFIDDYRLASQSLVIVEFRDGRQVRWKNLEKVWILLNSEKEFLPYVQEGVSSYLKGAG
jgi:hypothetical protein